MTLLRSPLLNSCVGCTLFVLFVCITSLRAQDVSLLVSGGLNVSVANISHPEQTSFTEEKGSIMSIPFGGELRMHVTNSFAVGVGVTYVVKGYAPDRTYHSDEGDYQREGEELFAFLEVPVTIRFESSTSAAIRPSYFIGISPGFSLWANSYEWAPGEDRGEPMKRDAKTDLSVLAGGGLARRLSDRFELEFDGIVSVGIPVIFSNYAFTMRSLDFRLMLGLITNF